MISIPMKARPVVTAATPRGSRAHGRIANKLFGIGEQANQFTHERNGLRSVFVDPRPTVGRIFEDTAFASSVPFHFASLGHTLYEFSLAKSFIAAQACGCPAAPSAGPETRRNAGELAQDEGFDVVSYRTTSRTCRTVFFRGLPRHAGRLVPTV